VTGQNPNTTSFPLRGSLSKKILAALVVGAAVTTICSALFGYYYAQEFRRENVGETMQRVAESMSDHIDNSVVTATQSMRLLADCDAVQRAFMQAGAPDESQETSIKSAAGYETLSPEELLLLVNQKLEAAASSNPGFRSLRVVNRDEKKPLAEFGESGSPYPEQQKWWNWKTVTSQGKPAVSQPFFEEGSTSAIILLCVPIRSETTEALMGALHAEYRLDHILSPTLGKERDIVAFHLSDHTQPYLHILSSWSDASSRLISFREQGEKIAARKSGWSMLEFDQPHMAVISGFSPVRRSLISAPIVYHGNNWYVVAGIPQDQALAPVNTLFFKALGFGGGILILVSLGGLAFARQILRPIHMLQDGVQKIGDGNIEHRLDVRSGDEIEMLASEFNRMADRMQRTQEQLQRRVKELEQRVNQLRRLQAQLTQSERMAATGELAAQIAHEINNPLGIIKNYVGIARMLMPEEDENRENLKIVDQEINRIAGIVRRLLKFAKPGTEDIQQAQINQILEELLALLRGQLFRRKIEVVSEFTENLPEVSVSTDQMRQVFLNLIKNAEDAMPEGGKLIVGTRYRKGRVEIEIADDGCGIPSEDVKNIFEPFFTTKGVKGTGLGLSVSYGIIKNYNGEIEVESEPGKGTTFTIQLPVVSDKVFQVIRSP